RRWAGRRNRRTRRGTRVNPSRPGYCVPRFRCRRPQPGRWVQRVHQWTNAPEQGAGLGDESFDEFYRATAARTYRYTYALCGDIGIAQDLTQEAYIRAWQRWRRVSGYEHAESWVRLVATRLAIDRWRRSRARHRVEAAL